MNRGVRDPGERAISEATYELFVFPQLQIGGACMPEGAMR